MTRSMTPDEAIRWSIANFRRSAQTLRENVLAYRKLGELQNAENAENAERHSRQYDKVADALVLALNGRGPAQDVGGRLCKCGHYVNCHVNGTDRCMFSELQTAYGFETSRCSCPSAEKARSA